VFLPTAATTGAGGAPRPCCRYLEAARADAGPCSGAGRGGGGGVATGLHPILPACSLCLLGLDRMSGLLASACMTARDR
jgi:hypothetical protein